MQQELANGTSARTRGARGSAARELRLARRWGSCGTQAPRSQSGFLGGGRTRDRVARRMRGMLRGWRTAQAAGGALSVVCAVATPTTRHCTACVAGPGVCRHLVAVVSRSTVGGQRVPHNGPLSPRYTFTFSQTVSQLFHIPPEYSPPGATQISIVASEIHMEIHVHVYLLSRSVQLSDRETCACRSGHRGRAASCDAAYTRTPLSMHHGMHPPPVPDQRRHTHARTRHTLEFNTTGSRRHLHIRCTSDYTTSPCRSHWLSYPRRRCSPAQLAGHPRLTSSWP